MFIIYTDLECLIEKTHGCKTNLENVGEHILSGFPMSIISSFENIENKFDVYWGKDSMKKFSKFLREYALEIINLKKKKWSY